MSFKESFEHLVTEIERLICYDCFHGYLKANEIIEIIQKQEGKSARDLNTIFEYISGKSLNRYIKDRKMMATYKNMIRDDSYDVQSYIDSSGYDNESSFSTAFSDKFGISPKKAYQQKDESKIEAPISIDSIIKGQDLPHHVANKSEMVWGLPKDVIEKYNIIREYQALFGLEDKYVDLVVYLNKKKGADLKEAFETVDNLVMDYSSISVRQSLKAMLDYINIVVPAVYIKHLYPDVCLPELNDWYFHMKDEGGNALEETPEFVRVFFDNVSVGISYKELKALYSNYLDDSLDMDDFREYVQAVNQW